ncbi:hypothetical protein ACFV9W_08565 [Streptomyces sp. NPDC059897]|uniref:hypothetical protein n=1 Tax=Streptomyces sp. NPDC059897 TaxID=3346994 RepID=UPI003664BBC0
MGVRTRAAAAAPALLLALLLSGCGSGDDGGGVASANKAKESTAGAKSSLSPEEKGAKYAQCMRENGIPMEDPKPGEGVRLQIDGSIPKETVDKALEACRKYQPQGTRGGGNGKQGENMREYAACMRENGVDAFPDPTEEGGIRIDGSVSKDPDFKDAQKACQDVLGGAGEQLGAGQ